MKGTLVPLLWMLAFAHAGTLGCSIVVNADFDVHRRETDARPSDTGTRSNDAASEPGADTGQVDAISDASDAMRDGGAPDSIDPRADGGADGDGTSTLDRAGDTDATGNDGSVPPDGDITDGGGDESTDAGDPPDSGGPEPSPEAGPPTIVGGFVSTGLPTQVRAGIELRGHIVSNAIISGSTATGISIEGRFR